MQAKFGAIVISGSGKIGGQAFSNTGRRPKLSAISPGLKRNAGINQLNPYRFASLTRSWRLISEAARLSWQEIAKGTESNFQAFVRCNMRRYATGLNAINSYSSAGSTLQLNTFSAVADESAQTLLFAGTVTNVNSARVHISVSPQQSPGIKSNARGYWMADYGVSNGIPTRNYSAVYTARYGPLVAGKKIFYKFEVSDFTSGNVFQTLEGFLIVST